MGMVRLTPAEPIRGNAYTQGDNHIPYDKPYDLRFTSRWGWNRSFTVLDDPRAFKLIPQFANWSKGDHLREALHAIHCAQELHASWSRLVSLALIDYGSEGSLISGVVRDHFPTEVKDTLRMLAHRAGRESQRSFAHWKAAGKRAESWRNRFSGRYGA